MTTTSTAAPATTDPVLLVTEDCSEESVIVYSMLTVFSSAVMNGDGAVMDGDDGAVMDSDGGAVPQTADGALITDVG